MRIGTDTVETLNLIVGAVRQRAGLILDGHSSDRPRPCAAVALQTRLDNEGRELGSHVVMLCAGTPYYCVNPLELLDTGEVRLSPWSVGSTITKADCTSFEQQIEKYNVDHGTVNPFFRARLSHLVRI